MGDKKDDFLTPDASCPMPDLRKVMRSVLPIVLVSLSLAVACQAGKPLENDVRSPTFAGRFYPDSAPVLKLAVQKFMEDAVPARVKDPVAIIVPHAGYLYSGQICADGYRQVSGRPYDTVVILGTNHTNPGFGKISVFSGDGYRTPLGIAGVDKGMASALAAADPDCVLEDLLHVREHSVEVQVPFVQFLFPKARIVPVIVGTQEVDACQRFGRALAKVIRGTRTLIVASTDLSHYPDAKDAAAVDGETLAAVATLDATVLHEKIRSLMNRHVPNLDTCACGEAPMMAAMTAAKALGATAGTVVSYLNSGDVPVGERERVVGYAAVALASGTEKPSVERKNGSTKTPDHVTLTPSEKKTLLAFARESIARYLATRTIPLARGFDPRLQIHRGVFVTLLKKGELRGCIGHVPADTPLVHLVGAMALKSAFGDPRFYPLGDEELGQVEIEISMLTLPRIVSGPADFLVGRHGVILQKEGHAALFLPQVAPREGWGRDETLDHLCLKAGLDKGCWKEGARLSTFEAIVFSESEFR